MLSRGHCIIVVADEAMADGAHAVRVVNDRGEELDAMLDAASERTVRRGGRVSLGPLPRGMYSVGLRTASGGRNEQVAIRGGDVGVRLR